MASEQLPAWIDLGADGLGNTKNNAAGERAPEIAEAADDHSLEAEDQTAAADGGIKACPDAEKDACNRCNGK